MKTSNAWGVKNQFLMEEEGNGANGNFLWRKIFQSYDSIIAEIIQWQDRRDVKLDESTWDYSKTTGKYRNKFLGEDRKETEKKIKDGTYILTNLN